MNMIKKCIITILLIALAVLPAACTNGKTNSKSTDQAVQPSGISYPVTIKDSFGRNVKLEKEPQRIISVAPNITEIIFALGKADKLVGRTDYCDYPEEAKKVASIGGLKNPSIEKIVELKPDLVIASTHFDKEVLNKLEELNIKVAEFYGSDSFDGAYDAITNVGLVLNAQVKAEEVIAGMKKKVAEVQDKVKGKDKPSIYYVVAFGKSGDYTAGGDTFIGQMIDMAGGKNAAADVKGWKYSLEKLVENNPDIMVCSKLNNEKEGIINSEGYKELKAVKSSKLYEIDNNLLNRQGPRLADGLSELARLIHPEAFK